MITALVLWRFDVLTVGEITSRHYVGVGIAALILLVGGILDDHYHLPPYVQIIAPALAAIAAIVGGVGIEKMTNPFGGVIFLEYLFFYGSWESCSRRNCLMVSMALSQASVPLGRS
ncbi:hypothetical protein HYV72_01260 [Candidatus Uhrbacteria bacterium]|nr:hypothetical protein [Candidatus Uhrbacteria bacterium]